MSDISKQNCKTFMGTVEMDAYLKSKEKDLTLQRKLQVRQQEQEVNKENLRKFKEQNERQADEKRRQEAIQQALLLQKEIENLEKQKQESLLSIGEAHRTAQQQEQQRKEYEDNKKKLQQEWARNEQIRSKNAIQKVKEILYENEGKQKEFQQKRKEFLDAEAQKAHEQAQKFREQQLNQNEYCQKENYQDLVNQPKRHHGKIIDFTTTCYHNPIVIKNVESDDLDAQQKADNYLQEKQQKEKEKTLTQTQNISKQLERGREAIKVNQAQAILDQFNQEMKRIKMEEQFEKIEEAKLLQEKQRFSSVDKNKSEKKQKTREKSQIAKKPPIIVSQPDNLGKSTVQGNKSASTFNRKKDSVQSPNNRVQQFEQNIVQKKDQNDSKFQKSKIYKKELLDTGLYGKESKKEEINKQNFKKKTQQKQEEEKEEEEEEEEEQESQDQYNQESLEKSQNQHDESSKKRQIITSNEKKSAKKEQEYSHENNHLQLVSPTKSDRDQEYQRRLLASDADPISERSDLQRSNQHFESQESFRDSMTSQKFKKSQQKMIDDEFRESNNSNNFQESGNQKFNRSYKSPNDNFRESDNSSNFQQSGGAYNQSASQNQQNFKKSGHSLNSLTDVSKDEVVNYIREQEEFLKKLEQNRQYTIEKMRKVEEKQLEGYGQDFNSGPKKQNQIIYESSADKYEESKEDDSESLDSSSYSKSLKYSGMSDVSDHKVEEVQQGKADFQVNKFLNQHKDFSKKTNNYMEKEQPKDFTKKSNKYVEKDSLQSEDLEKSSLKDDLSEDNDEYTPQQNLFKPSNFVSGQQQMMLTQSLQSRGGQDSMASSLDKQSNFKKDRKNEMGSSQQFSELSYSMSEFDRSADKKGQSQKFTDSKKHINLQENYMLDDYEQKDDHIERSVGTAKFGEKKNKSIKMDINFNDNMELSQSPESLQQAFRQKNQRLAERFEQKKQDIGQEKQKKINQSVKMDINFNERSQSPETLEQVFRKKNQRLAERFEQKKQDSGQEKQEKTRTKEDILKLRKEMMKRPSLNQKKEEEPEQQVQTNNYPKQMRSFHDPNKMVNEPNQDLMHRLATGQKAYVPKAEYKAFSSKQYEKLPENKKKQEEEAKKEAIRQRQEKVKELDRRTRQGLK